MENAQEFPTTGENPKQILESIIQQIWAARRLTHKNLPTESEQAYRKVAEFARKHGRYAESLIVQAAIYELREQFEEAMWYFEQAACDKDNQLKGIAWFFLGSVYRERYISNDKEKQDNAIKYYENALAEPAFDKRHWAQNNMANIYFRKQEYDKADELYQDCLKAEDGTRYISLYNLGRMALDQKDADGEKDYEKAIEYFQQAFDEAGDDYDMLGACKREMGTAYILITLDRNIDEVSKAILCWKEAENEFDAFDKIGENQTGKSRKAAVTHAKIRIANRLLAKGDIQKTKFECRPDEEVLLRWWPPEETGPDGYSTPEERIFSQIEAVKYDRYHQYNDKKNSRFAAKNEQEENSAKNVLAILRGWGSASPLIEDASSSCRGGGYFLKWRDKGLIIDPGLDFMYNFRANGFHMREVQAVAISHDHTDHNFDLGAIDDVFYEMSKRTENEEAKLQWSYNLYCDEGTRKKDFLNKKAVQRQIFNVDYNDVGTYKNKEKSFDLTQGENKNKCLPFRIHFFRVKHGKDFPAFGIRVECIPSDGGKPIVVGFTCDTEYFEQIDKYDNDKLVDHLQGCDILVAHVSQPTLGELLTNRMPPRENHLGYRGVAKLVKNCNPKLTVIGEFWAGFADMRIDIAKGLKRINDKAVIIPSSIGLFINPKTGEIECSNCKKWEPAANIHVTAAKDEFGPLGYICSLCRMNP
ncbi:MAG: MBL fold metallo-hydrolase [Bacteroidota bacterium]